MPTLRCTEENRAEQRTSSSIYMSILRDIAWGGAGTRRYGGGRRSVAQIATEY